MIVMDIYHPEISEDPRIMKELILGYFDIPYFGSIHLLYDNFNIPFWIKVSDLRFKGCVCVFRVAITRWRTLPPVRRYDRWKATTSVRTATPIVRESYTVSIGIFSISLTKCYSMPDHFGKFSIFSKIWNKQNFLVLQVVLQSIFLESSWYMLTYF